MFFHYDFYILHLIFSIIISAGKIAIYHFCAYFAGACKIATAFCKPSRHCQHQYTLLWLDGYMVFNAHFNNI